MLLLLSVVFQSYPGCEIRAVKISLKACSDKIQICFVKNHLIFPIFCTFDPTAASMPSAFSIVLISIILKRGRMHLDGEVAMQGRVSVYYIYICVCIVCVIIICVVYPQITLFTLVLMLHCGRSYSTITFVLILLIEW